MKNQQLRKANRIEEKAMRLKIGDTEFNLFRINKANKLVSPNSHDTNKNSGSRANILEVIMNEGKKTTNKMIDKMQNDEDAFFN